MDDRERALASTPPFHALGEAQRRELLPLLRIRSFQRGEYLFREGDPADTVFALARGRVKVVKAAPGGREMILEVFGPGDPVGMVAVLREMEFPAAAVAMEETEVLAMSSRGFYRALERVPGMARWLLLGLTERLVALTRRLADLQGGSVEYRMARLFLTLADRLGRREKGASIVPLHLTRQEIAGMVGTTVETAIRVMSRWQKERLVETLPEGFRILDQEGLEEIAGGAV